MEIIQFGKSELPRIRSLWEELNTLHGRKSNHCKDHFKAFTFEQRIEKLLDREHLSVFAAQADIEIVGYCLTTADDEYGELDSLYIQKAHRGNGLGKKLSLQALQWLHSLGCTDIRVAVAEGNEAAIPFYAKLGFQKRFTVLRLN